MVISGHPQKLSTKVTDGRCECDKKHYQTIKKFAGRSTVEIRLIKSYYLYASNFNYFDC